VLITSVYRCRKMQRHERFSTSGATEGVWLRGQFYGLRHWETAIAIGLTSQQCYKTFISMIIASITSTVTTKWCTVHDRRASTDSCERWWRCQRGCMFIQSA